MKVDGVYLTPIYSEKRKFSNYLVDTINGRVWSKVSGRFLTTAPNSNGYVYNRITDDDGVSSGYGTHRIVACSYFGLPIEQFCRGKIEVDHYPNEEEKWNNGINNLQMSSRKGQYRDSTRAKMGKGERLDDEVVLKIFEQLKEWQQDEDNKLSTFIWMMCDEHDRGYRTMWNIVNGVTYGKLYDQVFGE